MRGIDDCIPDLAKALAVHIKNRTHDDFGKAITDSDEVLLRALASTIKDAFPEPSFSEKDTYLK